MPRLAAPDPPSLPLLITMADANAAGLTPDQVRQRVRSGRWERVRPGTYRRTDWSASAGLDSFARARADHMHRAVAALRTNPGCVVGFSSALVVHGLPVASGTPSRVCLLAPPGHWTGRRAGLVIRQTNLEPEDVQETPCRITSPDRAWLDVARTATLGDALAAADAGLRSGVLDRNEMLRRVTRLEGGRGSRRAALAFTHASALRESVLESLSYAYFIERRVPLPECQVTIHDAAGSFVARVDFLWRAARLIGECDGRLKYATPDDLYREKRREDALRALGFQVVRWGAEDLRGARLATRLPST